MEQRRERTRLPLLMWTIAWRRWTEPPTPLMLRMGLRTGPEGGHHNFPSPRPPSKKLQRAPGVTAIDSHISIGKVHVSLEEKGGEKRERIDVHGHLLAFRWFSLVLPSFQSKHRRSYPEGRSQWSRGAYGEAEEGHRPWSAPIVTLTTTRRATTAADCEAHPPFPPSSCCYKGYQQLYSCTLPAL